MAFLDPRKILKEIYYLYKKNREKRVATMRKAKPGIPLARAGICARALWQFLKI